MLLRKIRRDDSEAVSLLEAAASGYRNTVGAAHPRSKQAADVLAAWRVADGAAEDAPKPPPSAAARDAGTERCAVLAALVVAAPHRAAALDAVAADLAARGVAKALCPLREADPLRDLVLARKGAAVVGVSSLGGGTRYAYCLDLEAAAGDGV